MSRALAGLDLIEEDRKQLVFFFFSYSVLEESLAVLVINQTLFFFQADLKSLCQPTITGEKKQLSFKSSMSVD